MKFVRKMIEADVASRDARGQSILARHDLHGENTVIDEQDRKITQAHLKELRRLWPNACALAPKKLSVNGAMKGGYDIYTHLSADSAHPSITSLERYVSRENGTATCNFDGAPTDEELVDTLMWGCVASLSAFIAGSQLLQATQLNEKLAILADEYRKLANAS